MQAKYLNYIIVYSRTLYEIIKKYDDIILVYSIRCMCNALPYSVFAFVKIYSSKKKKMTRSTLI
jgi:hypothetical protein